MDKLTKLRNTIDSIDESIKKLLEKRFEVAEEIGACKKEKSIDITDSARENEVIENIKNDVPDKYKDHVENVFITIIEESKNIQKNL